MAGKIKMSMLCADVPRHIRYQGQSLRRKFMLNRVAASLDLPGHEEPCPEDETLRMNRKRQLLILYLSMLAVRAGFGSILLLFPLYLNVGSLGIGIALSAYPLVEFVSAVPVGRYVDLKGRQRMLVLGLLSVSLLTMAISLTRNFYAVSVIHGIMGFCGAAVTVSSLAMITDLTIVSDRGLGMGGFDFSNIMGYAVGIVFATSLLHLTGSNYAVAFVATGIVLFCAAIASIIWVKETSHLSIHQSFIANPLAGIDPGTLAILPLWFGLTYILGVIFVLPRMFIESGLHSSQVGLTLSLGAFGIGIGSVLFGRVSDKIGRGKTLAIGVVGMILLLLSALHALRDGRFRIYQDLPIIGLSAFIATAVVPSALAYVGDKANRNLRGSAMGIYSMMLSLGMAIGNVLGGYFGSIGGLRAILEASAGLFLIAISASLALLYRTGALRLMRSKRVAEGTEGSN